MKHEEVISEIEQLVHEFNHAIQSRGGQNETVYQKFLPHIRKEFFLLQIENIILSETCLSKSQIKLVIDYIVLSSFVSNYYNQTRKRNNRDSVINSCTALISSLGVDPLFIHSKYLDSENFWRIKMKEEGLGGSAVFGKLLFLVFLALILLVVFYLLI